MTYSMNMRIQRGLERAMKSWSMSRQLWGTYLSDESGFHSDMVASTVPWSLDIAAARAGLIHKGLEILESQISHCTQSLEAMPRLVNSVELPWPFLAMSRITVEAASRLVYLTDRKVDAEQRLMRFAAQSLWNNREMLKARRASRGPLSRAQQKIDVEFYSSQDQALERVARTAGFVITRGRDGKSAPVVSHPYKKRPTETSDQPMSHLLESQFPGAGDSLYRFYSGHVHGTQAVQFDAMRQISETAFVPWISEEDVAATYAVVLSIVARALDSVAAYGGMRYTTARRQLEKTRSASVQWVERVSGQDRHSQDVRPSQRWHVMTQGIRARSKHSSAQGSGTPQ